MLSDPYARQARRRKKRAGLNAPYGAPYFLTCRTITVFTCSVRCLNAPYGTPRFLPRPRRRTVRHLPHLVLMHLMVLRAF